MIFIMVLTLDVIILALHLFFFRWLVVKVFIVVFWLTSNKEEANKHQTFGRISTPIKCVLYVAQFDLYERHNEELRINHI